MGALPTPPVLIFDGHCGFCRIWIEYWKLKTQGRITYAPSQEFAADYPQIPPEAFKESVQLVRPDGSFSSGARAVFETLGHERLYASIPGLARVSEWAYRRIARNRGVFYQITRFTFGTRIEPARFELVQWLFLKALAVVYLIAFASLAVQVAGLIGEDGISPAHDLFDLLGARLGVSAYFTFPSLFWLDASARTLQAAAWTGVALSAVLLAGYFTRTALVLLYLLYLSFSHAGQEFLTFQWDALLLEAGFLAIFFGRSDAQTRTIAWLYRWLVFRLYFLSGYVKLASGDATWRDGTALRFHYHTQPLPTRLAWYADKLPDWMQKVSTFGVISIELVMPFLIFLPRRWRMTGALVLIGLQLTILATGNYTFFNLLTIALTLFLFDDLAIRGKLSWIRSQALKAPAPAIGRAAFAAVILVLGWLHLAEAIRGILPRPLAVAAHLLNPLQMVHSYGLFAVMTTTRPEIVIDGSYDGENWSSYEFRYKPGDLRRPPQWVAPHQPRLDWQMWFAALDDYRASPWFLSLAEKLLRGSPAVIDLFESNPFPGKPPRWIRASLFEYSFTDFEVRRRTGAWWQREPRGLYLPPIALRSE